MEKAWVALALAILTIVNLLWGEGWWDHFTEEVVGVIIAALIPIFVWLVPNSR
jgi:hypothetical protein